ncbi:hypothetical protein Tco_0374713, partial [Tanacetum coccineum]
MEEYITTTQEDYSSCIARPKIDDKANFEVVLFYKAFNVPTRQILDSKGAILSMKAAEAKKAIQEMVNHSQKWHDGTSTRRRFRDTASGFYQRDSGNNSYQEQRQTLEESLKSFMAESSKRHDDNNNLIKEIRSSTDAALRNQGASI